MAKASKGARRIAVNDVEYRWRTKLSDDGLSLSIWPADHPGTTIICRFDYELVRSNVENSSVLVTNRIVRRCHRACAH